MRMDRKKKEVDRMVRWLYQRLASHKTQLSTSWTKEEAGELVSKLPSKSETGITLKEKGFPSSPCYYIPLSYNIATQRDTKTKINVREPCIPPGCARPSIKSIKSNASAKLLLAKNSLTTGENNQTAGKLSEGTCKRLAGSVLKRITSFRNAGT